MTLKTVALCGGVAVIVAVGVWAMLDHGGNRTASAGPTEWKAPARLDEGRPLSPDAARSARAAHYQEFTTLAQTRALPSYFARKEALYALAGRSDASAVRSLVSEANRIHDQRERLESLEILLTRFVEIDPEDALRAALNMDRAASAELVPVVIGAWSRTDLAAAATASKELPTPVLKAAAVRAILARHAAGDAQQVRQLAAELGVQEEADSALFEAHAGDALSDPHRALQAALAQGNSVQQQKAVGEIARAWAEIAPDEAWEYGAQLTDPAARLAFQEAVVDVWAAEQPSAAFARIVELPADWQRGRLLRRVTAELAQRDPRLAVEMVKGLPTQESEQLQNLVAAEWSRTDPTGAAQWIQAQGQASLSRLAYQIAAPYVTQKPDEALAWALRVSRSPGKNLWSHMVGIIAEQNPEAALQLALSAESPTQRTQALSAVIGSIAARDPALAMSQLEKLPPGQARTQALTQIGMRVAEGSPERSLEWLKGIEDPQARRQVAQSVVARIAQRDDAAATRLLDRVPDDLRGAWIRGIGNAYVNAGDFEQGAQWAKRFQDDPIYVSLVGTLATRSGEQQDSDVLFDLISKVPDARVRDQLFVRSVNTLAWRSPEAAVKSLDRISTEQQRASAMANITSVWLQRDYPEARKWALSLDTAKGRDAAVAQVVANQRTSVDDALSLVAQLRTPESRSSAVFNKAMQLARSNPEEMRTLLRRYPLDPARQRQLDRVLEAGAGAYDPEAWYAGD